MRTQRDRLRDLGRGFFRGFAMGFVFLGAMVSLYRIGFGHLPGLAGWLAFVLMTIALAMWVEADDLLFSRRRPAAPSGLYNSRGTQ